MTRHPTARRVHRADAAPDDVFVANVLETSVWAKQHARTLIIAAIAVVAVALFVFFYTSNARGREERAATELGPLRALAQSQQTEQAIPQLEAFVANYGGTKAGGEARLLLGQQYLTAGQAQKALDVVRPVEDDLKNPIAVNAALIEAAAHEAAQEPHRAEEVFIRLGEDAPYLFQRHDALDNAARLRMARGDAAGAAEIYQQLIDSTPAANPVMQVWQLRQAEARAAAGNQTED